MKIRGVALFMESRLAWEINPSSFESCACS
jgi:hypothetical protein